jgi:glycosyltransferase involved in cell wall biosynthesis
MKILEMNYEFPPVGGGGGRATEDLAIELSRLGHCVSILTARQGSLPRRESRDGFTVERIFAFRRRQDRCSVPEMVGYIAAAIPAGVRLARKFKPDLIHAHFAVPTGFAAWALSRLTGVPYVLTAHLGDVPGGTPEQTDIFFRYIKPLTVPVWHGASATTAVSSYVADLAKSAYGVDAVVIPNGVDLQKAPAHASRPGKSIKLVFAGRMVLQKNLGWGLDRLATVRDNNWTFDLFGDGPCRLDLEKQCIKLGLADRVKFHGWISPQDVDREMERADILFMPSLTEGLSLTAVNALAYGLAFACSRIGGFADVVIDGQNGISIPPDDAAGFERGLAGLLGDPERLFGMKQASKRMAGSFERKLVAQRYESVLAGVLNQSERKATRAKAG